MNKRDACSQSPRTKSRADTIWLLLLNIIWLWQKRPRATFRTSQFKGCAWCHGFHFQERTAPEAWWTKRISLGYKKSCSWLRGSCEGVAKQCWSSEMDCNAMTAWLGGYVMQLHTVSTSAATVTADHFSTDNSWVKSMSKAPRTMCQKNIDLSKGYNITSCV